MSFKPSRLVEYNTIPGDGPPREVGSTQVELPELRVPVLKWAMQELDPSWIVGNGVEERPHVTVMYGLEEDDALPIYKIAAAFGRPIRLEITALDRFAHAERDVLIAKIKSPDLHELRGLLNKLPNRNTYPKYIPHMTIAYLKKDKALPFIGKNPFRGRYSRLGFTHSRKDFTEDFVPTMGLFRSSPLR